MKSRTAAWLAWSMCLVAAAAIAGALAVVVASSLDAFTRGRKEREPPLRPAQSGPDRAGSIADEVDRDSHDERREAEPMDATSLNVRLPSDALIRAFPQHGHWMSWALTAILAPGLIVRRSSPGCERPTAGVHNGGDQREERACRSSWTSIAT